MKEINLEFEAIGTKWVIDFMSNPEVANKIAKLVADRISLFDHNYSRFRPDSWIIKAGKNPGAHTVPSDFGPLINFYLQMYKATDGLVTPLIGETLERAGYDAQYSLKPKAQNTVPKLEDAIEFKDNTLHVKYKCVLDFGAAGKGYLIDLIGKLLNQQGIDNYVIDAGGDILYSPAPPKTTSVNQINLGYPTEGRIILLENPDFPGQPQKAIGQAHLTGSYLSICGSAGNRRAWGKKVNGKVEWHHIINPGTQQPVRNI